MYRIEGIGKIDVHYVNDDQRSLVRRIEHYRDRKLYASWPLYFSFIETGPHERFIVFTANHLCGEGGATMGTEFLNGGPNENFSPSSDGYISLGPPDSAPMPKPYRPWMTPSPKR